MFHWEKKSIKTYNAINMYLLLPGTIKARGYISQCVWGDSKSDEKGVGTPDEVFLESALSVGQNWSKKRNMIVTLVDIEYFVENKKKLCNVTVKYYINISKPVAKGWSKKRIFVTVILKY